MKIEKKARLALVFPLFCAVVMQSCVDDSYNMDNVSNSSHLFENGISIPLGNSENVSFSDYIDEVDNVSPREDGVYKILSEGQDIDIPMPDIDIDIEGVNFASLSPTSYNLSVVLPTNTEVEIPLPTSLTEFTTSINFMSESIPSEVEEIKTIYANIPITISFDILDSNGGNLSSLDIDKLKFDGYQINLPSDFIFDDSRVDNNNKMFVDETIERGDNGFSIEVEAIGIRDIDYDGGRIIVSSSLIVGAEGVITVIASGSGVVNENIKLASAIDMGTFNITSLDCEMEIPVSEPFISEVGSTPEFLEDGTFHLSNILYLANVTNGLNSNLRVDMVMQFLDENREYITDGEGSVIEVNIEDLYLDKSSTSDIYFATDRDTEYDSRGFTFVSTPEFEKIKGIIPRYIETTVVNIESTTDYITADLSVESILKVESKLDIPFIFDRGTKFKFVEDLSVKDIFSSITLDEFALKLRVDNRIPAEVVLDIVLFDEFGNEISGVDYYVEGSILPSPTYAITPDVESKTSRMEIRVVETEEGAISQISSVEFDFNFEIDYDNIPLTKYQGIDLHVSAEASNGVELDME